MPSKEHAYDEFISPLMTQIIALCKEHKIPMVADFSLDEEEGLKCTTVLFGDDWPLTEQMRAAEECIRPRNPPSVMMVTEKDGSGKVTRMTAIL